jgi:hypothetical protein
VQPPTLLEQQELLAADHVAVAPAAPPELGLPDLVDRFGQVALDVNGSNTMSACGACVSTALM